MTRVRMCEKNPGLIIRHHDFENYPKGIASHTTAPLDYAILALALMLKPFTSQPLDLAGAIISPLFGLLAGWFLWWWARQMQFPFRGCMLTLYALSPILVHGTELGRPDHQSLLILLVLIAIAAEWRLQTEESRIWSAISGATWGLAFWVSLYEPLILLLIVIALGLLRNRHFFRAQHRRTGWILFALIVALAVAIERHVPPLPFSLGTNYLHWSRTIGELMSVSPTNLIWFQWVGWLLIAAPLLIWLTLRRKTTPDGPTRRRIPSLVLVLLGTTYLLTLWQTRWAYFFVAIFCLTIPKWLRGPSSGLRKSSGGRRRRNCLVTGLNRFSRRGGFRHPRSIGRVNREWLGVPTRVSPASQTPPIFFSRLTRDRRCKFFANVKSPGCSVMMPIVLLRTRPQSWEFQPQLIRFAQF